MSWENFQEDAFNLTRAEIKQLTNSVLSNYRQALRSIDSQLKNVYAKLTDVSSDNYYNEMIKRDRLENLFKQLKAEYSKFTSLTARDIKSILSMSFSNTYYRKIFAASWVTDKSVFGLLPSKLTKLAVLGTNEAWKDITASIIDKYGDMTNYMPRQGSLLNLLKNNANKELNSMRNLITQKLIGGNSYTQTINGIKDIIGREFKDGKVIKATGAKSSALRIIRTESNRIMNAGSYAASKTIEDAGVDVKRRLVSTLDNRTRRQSATMDGQTVKVGEPFRYPNGAKAIIPGTTGVPKYDINDRETVVDIVNNVEPVVRIGRDPVTGENEYFSYRNFDEWAKDKGLTRNKYGEVVVK
jgi:hypothetical protein